MGQYVLIIKKIGPGLGLLRGILEIWLNGARDPLEKIQKHFGQVIQTLLDTPLKPNFTQIGTLYPTCTIWRVNFGPLSFYDNYLTKVLSEVCFYDN